MNKIPSWLSLLFDAYSTSASVSIDTRTIQRGDIFFAIRGERFDGHDYVQAALDEGASLVVIDKVEYKGEKCLLVPDSLQALQHLAAYYRKQLDIPVLAITGSNGKTTTKNLIISVLSTGYNVHGTAGNFNNHIGLPLTILSCPKDAEVLILEMGANHIGEIKELCQIGNPDLGLITNIGIAHLEGFGSIEGVRQAKGELYDHLKEREGLLFINRDEAHLEALAGGYGRIIRYDKSQIEINDIGKFEIDELSFGSQISFRLKAKNESVRINSELFGLHNLQNIITATAVGLCFRLSLGSIQKGVALFKAKNNRSERVSIGNNEFILDAYNANPTSMKSSLESFSQLTGEYKIAVLGDMLELGEDSLRLHRNIYEQSLGLSIDEIILVGPIFSGIESGRNNVKIFENVGSLKEWWSTMNYENTLVLIKGSRGIGLEKLLQD